MKFNWVQKNFNKIYVANLFFSSVYKLLFDMFYQRTSSFYKECLQKLY